MTAPAQYPELPEAYDGMPSQEGKGILDGFTADQMRAYVDAAREQDRARAGKAQAASHSAPERIYLDIGDQFDLERVLEGGLSWQSLEGVTWSEDNATGYGIEYIRADRAHAAAPPPAVGVSEADIDRIVPALAPMGEEFPAEWALWKDRERIRAELRALSHASKPESPATHEITACYFPAKGEIDVSWRHIKDNTACALTLPVTPEQGEKLSSVVWPCLTHAAAPVEAPANAQNRAEIEHVNADVSQVGGDAMNVLDAFEEDHAYYRLSHEHIREWINKLRTALAAPAQGDAKVLADAELFKAACRLRTEHVVTRYLMSCSDGRWDGAEKALRHRDLCDFYVAVFYDLEDSSKAQAKHSGPWDAVHSATQALTDNLDEVIGFPLKGRPDYDALAPKFFERFHELAIDALRAARQSKTQGGK